MADAKITELSELTSVATTDLVPIVDDPSGSPVIKKITVDNLTAGSIKNTLVAAKGDLITATANDTPAIQSVGSNGQVLIADSTATNGIEWADPMASMARQAIINGNFDVWQRGTTVTNPADAYFLADRYRHDKAVDGGTDPTIVISRQALTPGDLPNSFYYLRINVNGAGSSYGANSYHYLRQAIEFGTRNLCGDGKKVTVSFYARSDIANKRFAPMLIQMYGTGGSPTADEIIKGTPITLTSTWTKYTQTFTTNTLVGKTFGTNNDDGLLFYCWYQWGTTIGNTYVQTSVSAESFVGSGNIDIAQVQLCAGDVALPFMPKSEAQEKLDCYRYYWKIKSNSAYDYFGLAQVLTTTTARMFVQFPVTMRTTPSLETAGNIGNLQAGGSISAASSIALSEVSEHNTTIGFNTSSVVAGNCSLVISNNDATAYLAFSAEL